MHTWVQQVFFCFVPTEKEGGDKKGTAVQSTTKISIVNSIDRKSIVPPRTDTKKQGHFKGKENLFLLTFLASLAGIILIGPKVMLLWKSWLFQASNWIGKKKEKKINGEKDKR